MISQAAQSERVPYRQELALATADAAREYPGWLSWGGGDPRLENLFGAPSASTSVEPLTEWMVRSANRAKVLERLQDSRQAAVQLLLRARSLTNTVIFSPSESSSGQALDISLAITGLLLEERKLTTSLSNAVLTLAVQSDRGSQRFEQLLLDMMSLGQRFNWGQLTVFLDRIDDAETLRLQTDLARRAGAKLPVLFSAVCLSGKPAEVARYLTTYSQSGLDDLGATLSAGSGGLNELLRRNQRWHFSSFREKIAAAAPLHAVSSLAVDYSWRQPWLALGLKCVLYLLSGFLIAVAMHFARPAVSQLERPLQVRGFHMAREILFALGFLAVVLLLSEPFLSQESQKVEIPFRLRLPMGGDAVQAGNIGAKTSFMNQMSLLTLVLFFVLQALIYTACLVKLAEIRRQKVPPRIKLKLLENEDHLFDAGLYLGFVGTIISLILVSLGVIKPSLMAAYSSTSFGIIFVSFFKIFHLRPVRRRLLLEAESMAPAAEPIEPAGARSYPMPS